MKLDRNNTNFTLRLYEYFRKAKWGDEYSFLKYYQNLARDYVNNIDVGARGLLIQHQMGLGKSILAIAIAMDGIDGGRPPIILLTKSLQENMRGAIHKYVDLRRKVEPDYHLGKLSPVELAAWIDKTFSFASMNASNMLHQVSKATEGHSAEEFDAVLESKFGEVLKLPSLNGKMLIVDEAHNLFRAITNGSKNGIGLYDAIMKSDNLKLIFLTGTPVANDVFELVPCFNMLAKGKEALLPESYREFYKLYVDEHGLIKNKGKFQNRIYGLVSSVSHKSTPGKAFGIDVSATQAEFPELLPTKIEQVHMGPEQYAAYKMARDKEMDEGGAGSGFKGQPREPPSMTKPKSKMASTYRVRSRQISNYFSYPGGGWNSPKHERILANINKHKNQLGLMYSQFTGDGGLGAFAEYLKSHGWKQVIVGPSAPAARVGGGSALPSVDEYLDNIDLEMSNYEEWEGGIDDIPPHPAVTFRYATSADVETIVKINPKWNAPDEMKFPQYILLILEDGQPTGYVVIEYNIRDPTESDPTAMCCGRVVSDFVEKISPNIRIDVIKKIISDAMGCAQGPGTFRKMIWGGDIDASGALPSEMPGRPMYFAIISGDVPVKDRTRIQDLFNQDGNKRGGIIDVLIISSPGAEGLDLKNGRHVHIEEPYWNIGRLDQVNYRFVRNDSHVALPPDEKNVQPYIYLAIPPESDQLPDGTYNSTTDTELYDEALRGQITIDSFIEAIQEVGIESKINNDPNYRECSPTNEPLFTEDPARDIRAQDPCKKLREEKIIAEEVIYDGAKFSFVPDTVSVYKYKIYIYDDQLDGYRALAEWDPRYAKIAHEINARGQ